MFEEFSEKNHLLQSFLENSSMNFCCFFYKTFKTEFLKKVFVEFTEKIK